MLLKLLLLFTSDYFTELASDHLDIFIINKCKCLTTLIYLYCNDAYGFIEKIRTSFYFSFKL